MSNMLVFIVILKINLWFDICICFKRIKEIRDVSFLASHKKQTNKKILIANVSNLSHIHSLSSENCKYSNLLELI